MPRLGSDEVGGGLDAVDAGVFRGEGIEEGGVVLAFGVAVFLGELAFDLAERAIPGGGV